MQRKKLTATAMTILLLFHSCTMISPSYISFENGSAYPITIYLEESDRPPLELKPGEKDFRPLTPGLYTIEIEIEELGFYRKHTISLNFLEKSRFIFQADS